MFWIALVLAAGGLFLGGLLVVVQAVNEELVDELAQERSDHAATKRLVAAVEAEVDAPIPFTLTAHVDARVDAIAVGALIDHRIAVVHNRGDHRPTRIRLRKDV